MVLDSISEAVHVAAAGPMTAFGEAAATSVGAGMVLGGFLAGLLGLVSGWDTPARERVAIGMGALGGLLMALGLAAETLIR